MSNGIVLSNGVRTNLLALQTTSSMQATVQERLATGKKVNSALDNPVNFFTAASLNRRGADLTSLLDGMSNGVKTLEAADNAVKAMTKSIETMQANLRQARQDKSWKGISASLDPAATGSVSIAGGSVGSTPVNLSLTKGAGPVYTAANAFTAIDVSDGNETYAFTVAKNGGTAVNVSLGAADNTGGGTTLTIGEAIAGINSDLTAGNSTIRVRDNGGALEFYDTDATNVGTGASLDVSALTTGGTTPSTTLGWTGDPAAVTGAATGGALRTVDELVAAVQADPALAGKVRASNDAGQFRLENLSTEPLTFTGFGSDGKIVGTGGTAKEVGGNDIRKNLMTQFNDMRTQLDKLGDDASFNGVNLLRGDKLKVVFNEQGTSRLDIEAKNKTGPAGISTAVNSLDIPEIGAEVYASDDLIEARLDKLKDSLTTLQTHASTLGSNLNVVQIRQEFTKQMVNTLETGADYLVNADMNEEGANLLSLNTRQQLSQTALSLASQADQSVLRLFG